MIHVKISPVEIERRVAVVLCRYGAQVQAGTLGGIFAALFPEVYAAAEATAAVTALPNTALRLEQMRARAERREPVLRPGDRQAGEDEGWLADSAVVIDEDGSRRPSGKGAGGARCRDDVPVDRAYASLRGGDRPPLPEVNAQQWTRWQEKRDALEAAPPARRPAGVTTVERIAERIRYFRELRGLSLGQLALKAGLSRTHLKLLERGRHDPGRVTLQRLAGGLRVSVDELLGAHVG